MESAHRFVTTENIFDRAGHYMVDAGLSIGRRRTFEKDKRGCAFALGKALFEQTFALPFGEHFFIDS